MFLPILFALALQPAQAADDFFQDAVIQGEAPSAALARSAVLILPADGDGEYCSGVLVAPDLVATAAHCVVKSDTNRVLQPSQMLVDFTSYFDGGSRKGQPIARVIGIRKRADYDNDEADVSGNPHDVALVRLAQPAPAGYVPARFLPRSPGLQVGTSVFVGGYGDTCNKCDDDDYRLRAFPFTVRAFRRPTTLVELRGQRAGGIANGDSGGPAFAVINGGLYLWGVLSSGNSSGSPAYYENLLEYKTWLEESARSMGSSLELP